MNKSTMSRLKSSKLKSVPLGRIFGLFISDFFPTFDRRSCRIIYESERAKFIRIYKNFIRSKRKISRDLIVS